MRTASAHSTHRLATLVLFALVLTACSLTSKPVASIGSPAHGTQVLLGQEVLVQINAMDNAGVARVELWVDGALAGVSQPPSPQAMHSAVVRWTPAMAGSHMIVAKAINIHGTASDPAAITVNVVNIATATTNAPPPTAPPPTVAPPPPPTSPPPAVTATLAPTHAPASPAACTNGAVFVEHVTVPDGTLWAPGQTFNKIWRVRNSGTCAWGEGFEFVYVGGELMAAPNSVYVPKTAAGSTADLLVPMVAPSAPGAHSGQWRLRSPTTGLFGTTMSVTINVPGPPTLPPGCPAAPAIAYFAANPATVAPGQPSTLSWGKVDNATSAVIDPGIGGVGTPGETIVTPPATTVYILTASGCGGTVTKQVTVTVVVP